MSHTDPQYPPPGEPSPSTPYPPTAHGHAGPGWPDDPAPPRPSGAAVAALVVGIVSVVLCLIPVVNGVSVLGGIAAVVLGIIALRKRSSGGPGKGFAITGIVLGAVATVIAVAMWVLVVLAIAGLQEGEVQGVIGEASAQSLRWSVPL